MLLLLNIILSARRLWPYPWHRLAFGLSVFYVLSTLAIHSRLLLEAIPDHDDLLISPSLPHIRSQYEENLYHPTGYNVSAQPKVLATRTEITSNESHSFNNDPSASDSSAILGWRANNNTQPATIDPIWTCSNTESQKKLVFIHVFKTAGSSFREFFKDYGRTCHRSMAIIVGKKGGECVQTPLDTVKDPNKTWVNKHQSPCLVKHAADQRGEVIASNKPFQVRFLQENSPDILIGHFSFGIHRHWLGSSSHLQKNPLVSFTSADFQYIAFFRHPIAKFVSARLYMRRFNQLDKAVAHIKEYVTQQRSNHRYYEHYSGYLTTHEQRASKPSNREKVQQIQQTLQENHFIVGIVERMVESNALVAYAIDGNQEFTNGFEKLNNPHSGSNKSTLSSTAIVRELEKDGDFMSEMKKYLKYEYEIYNFALQLHLSQYQWLSKMRDNTIATS